MRGGNGDPYDPNGSGEAETDGRIVIIWSAVAGVALLVALVALLYGAPGRNDDAPPFPQRAMDAVDTDPTGAIDGMQPRGQTTGERVGTLPPLDTRTDFGTPGGPGDVTRIQVENAALRQSVNTLRGQIDILSERIERMERRLGELTGSIGDRPAPTAALPRLTPAPVNAERSGGEALVSGEPRQTITQFGLELGSYDDLAGVRQAWRRLVEDRPDLFGTLDALATVRDRGGRTELLLVAGPFANAADASARCAEIERAGQACLPAFFLGQPLMMR